MNVLLVASRALDRDGPGDAKMGYWTQRALSEEGHDVSVVVLQKEADPRRALNVAQALVCGKPLQVGLTFSRATQQRVAQSGDPPLVIAVHARAAAHVPRRLRPRALALLIDSYGLSYSTYAGRLSGPAALVYRFERTRMDRYERQIVAEFARTAVVSELDRDYLARSAKAPESVLSLALPVDLAHFAQTRRRPAPERPVFVFVGRLNYVPNRDAVGWLAEEIWPVMRARWPAATLRVIGARPSDAIRRMLKRQGIELAADVPDIRPPLEDAIALLVPVRMGGGVQTKILEAMAAGVPVISTAFGCRGIAARPELEVLVAQTPADFERQAARLVGNPALGRGLSGGARAWVEAHHAPARYERELLDACAGIVGSGSAAQRPLS